MTKIIGLTGGIGSGKSTVAKMFADAGIPVYYADEASRAIAGRPDIQNQIRQTFGDSFFEGKKLDRKKLAAHVFAHEAELDKLNRIIHPAVKRDFQDWLSDRQSTWAVREAAILFESGSYHDCDVIVTVTAPVETRIARVMQRDGISREAVLARISKQWTDAEKAAKSDFVIENLDLDATRLKVSNILKKLNNF